MEKYALTDIEEITLIQREPFDYTKWRQELDEKLSIEDISRKAMLLRKQPQSVGTTILEKQL